jgi:hypothetical protein
MGIVLPVVKVLQPPYTKRMVIYSQVNNFSCEEKKTEKIGEIFSESRDIKHVERKEQ